MSENPEVPIPASPGRANERRVVRLARRREPARAGSMRVHDFVPIEEHFEQAGSVLVGGLGSWLKLPAAGALAEYDGVAIAFGEPRMIERGVVVALQWAAASGPFATLDADLHLEPMPPPRSHLSLSGSYEPSSSENDGNDAVTGHHLIESCVRRFLVGVAATLERARAEFPISAARTR